MQQIDPDSLDLDALEAQIKDQLDQAEFDPKMGKHTHITPNVAMALVKRCQAAEEAVQTAGEALQQHLEEE